MAQLVSGATTITIKPHAREKPTSNWFELIVGLEYNISGQCLYVELPTKEISMQTEEFETFFQCSRAYLAGLPDVPFAPGYASNRYFFTPLETRFNIEIGGGYYNDEDRRDGSLVVEFDMSLATIDPSYRTIGCRFDTKISRFVAFLDELEQEVKAL